MKTCNITKAHPFDQGVFNTACALVDEMVVRNYLHFLCEVDASAMDACREQAKCKGAMPPTYTAFVVKAAAVALGEHAHLNCMIQERPFSTRLVPLETLTATVAVERVVDGVDMVFAPMLAQPHERSLQDLTRQLRHFASADIGAVPEFARFLKMVRVARWLPWMTGKLLRVPSQSPALWRKYRGGSFAVTSPAKYGGCDQVLPPWPWPLTFSFGAVKPRPLARGHEVVVRNTMRLTITADRRLAHGAPLARFAARVTKLLEHPAELDSLPSGSSHEHATTSWTNDYAKGEPLEALK